MMAPNNRDRKRGLAHDYRPKVVAASMALVVIAAAMAFAAAEPLYAAEPVTVVKGGDIYTITSGVIRGGAIIVKDGKIAQIGRDLEIPKNAKVIDAKGKVVMPGLVAASTSRLPVFDSSSDKIAESLDPFNYTISLALASGVTSMYLGKSSLPFYFYRIRSSSGQPISGTNAVIKPTYGDLDNMLLKEPVVENLDIAGQWRQKTEFILKMRQAADYLRRLAAYEKSKKPAAKSPSSKPTSGASGGAADSRSAAAKPGGPKKPPGIDPYIRLLKRERSARLNAGAATDILAALELVDEFRFPLIIEDATEAWTIAEDIARRDVRLVITPRAKRRPNEDVSRPTGSSLENAAILNKAGVKFALIPPTADFATWGIAGRDLMTLPMEAAAAVSGGLDERTALEAITITAAEILGIEDRVGSLQVGKDADIIILDGHPLHYNTFVQQTLVNGKVLYEKSKSTYFSHIRRYEDKSAMKHSQPPQPKPERPQQEPIDNR
jgi:imidazolonepropionase-like amidohydrolase